MSDNCEKKVTVPTKIVIRKLPPKFTVEEFKSVIGSVPENNYFKFINGDPDFGSNAFSRVYINFKNSDEIFSFRDQFDGYVFVDQDGHEYPALVEYAPFQKIPKGCAPKKDPRCGTIDEDPDYLDFLEQQQQLSSFSRPQINSILEEIETLEREARENPGFKKIKTPLLEYVEQRYTENTRFGDKRRRREAERRRKRELAALENKKYKLNVKEDRRKEGRKIEPSVKTSGAKVYAEKEKKIVQDRPIRDSEKEKATHDKKREQSQMKKSKRYSEVRKSRERRMSEKDTETTRDDSNSTKLKEIAPSSTVKKEKEENVSATEISSSDTLVTRSDSIPISSQLSEMKENAFTDCQSSPSADRDVSKKNIGTIVSDVQPEDAMVDNNENGSSCSSRRDPRAERRIRNKDRPSIQLYRPGQSRSKNVNSQQSSEAGS